MKPKLSDVAKFAGVSLATADRVINKRSGVRDATRQKVMDAVAKLGYEPDPVAARLARSRKQIIAIVVPGDGDRLTKSIEHYWHLIQKKSVHARVQLRMAIYDMNRQETMLEELEKVCQEVDGILLSAPNTEHTRQAVRNITEKGVPIFSIFSRLSDGYANRYIGYDHYKIGRTATHLLKVLTNGKTGKILTYSTFLQMMAYKDRLEGQQSYLNEHDWSCELVQVPVHQDSTDQIKVLADYIDNNEDVVALICLGHETTDLIDHLSKRPKRYEHLKIVSVVIDMERRIVDALLGGEIDAILYLDAKEVARVGISALIEDLEKNCYQNGFADLASKILDFNIFVKENLPHWALCLPEER